MKNAELNTIILKDDKSGWFVGQIEEFPEVISQGETIDILKNNLVDALNLYLETQKDLLLDNYKDTIIERQKLVIS